MSKTLNSEAMDSEKMSLEKTNKLEISSENVVFKGYKTGLTLVIPGTGSFEQYLPEIKTRLEQSQDFFKGAKIILDTGGRRLSEPERSLLVQLIKEFGLNPHFLDEIKVVKQVESNQSTNESDSFKPTITVKKTVRSGQRVVFEGNLVIMGDVNPGAEVIASGDIIVLGTLRGTVHAGAQGDETAQIIAFQLKPVQIRIAGVITRNPEHDEKVKNIGPEMAKIKDGLIVVERYSS